MPMLLYSGCKGNYFRSNSRLNILYYTSHLILYILCIIILYRAAQCCAGQVLEF